MFERFIAEGRLAQPFGVSVSAGRYHLAWPSDRRATPAMHAFAGWLTGKAAA